MHKAELFIFDKKYSILDFELTLEKEADTTGLPVSNPYGGKMTIKFASSKNDTDILEAAMASRMMVKGYVRMYRRDGTQKLFDYEFANAFILLFNETFDATSKNPVTIKVIIAPGILKKEDWIFANYWNPSNPFIAAPVTVREADTPQITSLKWVNSDTEEQDISSIGYKGNASLLAVIENPEGSTAAITIEKEDGTEFSNGETSLSFTEGIDENGIVELTPMEIKEQWEEFKTSDIDKLVAKVTHGEASKTSNTLQIIPDPKIIVDFRPAKNYNGEYGFDYMRHKKNKDDSLTYKDILGTNKTVKNATTGKKTNIFTQYITDVKYKDLKSTHYTTTTFPWHKDANGKQIEYIQSWLTIYPKQKVTVSLQLETLDNPKKLDLSLEYDKTLFKLNTDVIPAQSKGKKRLKDHLEIECLKEFDTDQPIKVMYNKRQLGELSVLKNSKKNRYKADVVFVKVKTQLVTGTKLLGNTTGEQSFIEKYLNQALIKPLVVEEVLDLTGDKTFNSKFAGKNKGHIDNRTGIHAYLNGKMNIKYKNHLKVYFIPDKCPVFDKNGTKTGRINGQAMGIGADAVVVFSGHNKSTTTHEALHALGISHTFSNKAAYGYKKGETYNIMDYSHQSKYGSKKRILTWLWQWKILWGNKLVTKE